MAALYAGGLWAVGLDADDRDALRSLRNRAPGRRAAREAEALAEARLEPTASGLEPRA
jgi:hypothetical protein